MADISRTDQHSIIEQVLVMGDLARLTPEQRNTYYKAVCDSLGLNPLTKPFEFIVLNGKLTMYARKDCTDQLRKIHGVSIRIVNREEMSELMVVTAEATDRTGRTDSSIGAVSIANLKGEAKANALMKAETKARRRVTLALCGLGMLDETEVDTIPSARVPDAPRAADRLLSAPPSRTAHAVIEHAAIDRKSLEAAVESAPASPAAPATPEDDLSIVIDVENIEEHRGRSGSPVWKVITSNGHAYAVTDALVVEDISTALRNERPVRVVVEQRGTKRIIVDAQEVAE